MELILVIPAIFLVAALLSWITKIEIAYLFAPAIFFIAGWEFVFGLLGYLNLGMEFLILSIGLVLVFGAGKSGQFRSHLLKNSYAPSTVAFVLLSLISLYKSKDWVLSQWDEFTNWGLVVKAMYEYSALGPSTPVEMVAEKYPPGIPLFQYFVMDFSSGWREGLLFWATHLIVIAIIVSVLAKSSYRYLPEIALKLFVALLASSVFFNNFDNIYADPVLAISLGFLIVVAIQASHLDGRWAVVLAIVAGFAVLIKPVGIYIAAAAILINIVATLFTVKINSGKKVGLAFAPALIALTTVVSVWVTWRNYALSFGAPTVGPSDTMPSGFNVLTDQQAVISNFIRAFFNTAINPSYSASLPSLHWTIICGIFFVIWAMLNGRQNRKRNIAVGMTLLVTTAGYFSAILISYLTVFGPGEAVGLASYARYIGAWYQGVFFAIIMLTVSELSMGRFLSSNTTRNELLEPVRVGKRVGLFVFAFIGVTTLSSPHNYILMLGVSSTQGSEVRKQFIPVVEAIRKAAMPEQSQVYIIAEHTVGFEYYVLRYEMANMKFGKVPWSIGTTYGEGDIWTDPAWDIRKWSNVLRGYDYVVLYRTTESFNSEFGSLFRSGVIDSESVYRVVKNGEKVSLSKVN
jgi:hypothetical protein